MEQLEIQEKKGSNYILLEMSGTINAYTIGEFEKKSYDYIKTTNLVLGMENVIEIDSTGIGVLLGVYNEAEDTGTSLYLLHPSISVVGALEETGFFDSFNRIYSVTEVL